MNEFPYDPVWTSEEEADIATDDYRWFTSIQLRLH